VNKYVMIGLGGALGALARYQVAASIQSRIPSAFPWGTFVVNMSGCFLMGAVASILAGRIGISDSWRFLIPVGFIGAYTTFSTFELETFRAVTQGTVFIGGLNVIASVVAGYLALWLGVVAARWF
jgi:CrcB protein